MRENQPAVKHYFVDEAGDPVLFSGNGKVLIGSEGCSRYFAVGLLAVPDVAALAADLNKLRADLLADPYFKDVPSMQPDAKRPRSIFMRRTTCPKSAVKFSNCCNGTPSLFPPSSVTRRPCWIMCVPATSATAPTFTGGTSFTTMPCGAFSRKGCTSTMTTTFALPFAATAIAPPLSGRLWNRRV